MLRFVVTSCCFCVRSEDSFQKISACTGLNHPDAIVNKFFFKGEIRAQLQSDIDEKQAVLQRLAREEQQLRQQLEQARKGSKEQTWRDVEQLSESAREVQTRSSKAQQEIERVTQRLAFVQEGLLDLLRSASSEAAAALAAGGPMDGQHPHHPQHVAEHAQEVLESLESGDGGDEASEAGKSVKGLWSVPQSQAVLEQLDSSLHTLLQALSAEDAQRRQMQMELRGGAGDGASSAAGSDGQAQRTSFGFNLKHLRLLSQQNQLVEQQLAKQHSSGGTDFDEQSP